MEQRHLERPRSRARVVTTSHGDAVLQPRMQGRPPSAWDTTAEQVHHGESPARSAGSASDFHHGKVHTSLSLVVVLAVVSGGGLSFHRRRRRGGGAARFCVRSYVPFRLRGVGTTPHHNEPRFEHLVY